MTCLAGGTRLEARLYDGKGEPLSLSPLIDVVSGTTVDAKVAICRDATGMVRSSVYLGRGAVCFCALDPFIKSSQVGPQSQGEATISAASRGILAVSADPVFRFVSLRFGTLVLVGV
jgi:hypothetical protein